MHTECVKKRRFMAVPVGAGAIAGVPMIVAGLAAVGVSSIGGVT